MQNEYAAFLTLKIFLIAWKAGQENLSDYFTKHHSIKQHKRVRPIYLQTDKMSQTLPTVLLNPSLQGCVDPEDSKMEQSRKISPIPCNGA